MEFRYYKETEPIIIDYDDYIDCIDELKWLANEILDEDFENDYV